MNEWYKLHAARLQALLEAPYPANDNAVIHRAIYEINGEMVCTKVYRVEGQPVAVRSSRLRSTDVMQGDMDGYEIAAFLGLHLVDPETVKWRAETLPGRAKGSPLAVVRGGLPEVKTGGR